MIHRPSYSPDGQPRASGYAGSMSNRLPVGPGSRGGRWHDPEYRRAYHRAWRAAHPDYREREALRRQRARDRFTDPAGIESTRTFPRPLPVAAVACICDCGCRAEVPVVACGFCLLGEHEEAG